MHFNTLLFSSHKADITCGGDGGEWERESLMVLIRDKSCFFFCFLFFFHSFSASGICHLLITFANSLNTDQARQNIGPDLDPKCLTLR